MSSLRVPSFGPIVGHTTEYSSRIWILSLPSSPWMRRTVIPSDENGQSATIFVMSFDTVGSATKRSGSRASTARN